MHLYICKALSYLSLIPLETLLKLCALSLELFKSKGMPYSLRYCLMKREKCGNAIWILSQGNKRQQRRSLRTPQ